MRILKRKKATSELLYKMAYITAKTVMIEIDYLVRCRITELIPCGGLYIGRKWSRMVLMHHWVFKMTHLLLQYTTIDYSIFGQFR